MANALKRSLIPVTIANGGTTTGEFSVDSGTIVGIQMPAAWTAGNLTAQAVTRQAAGNPVTPTFGNVVDGAGAPLVIAATPTADTYYPFTEAQQFLFRGLGRVRLVAGAAQGGQRDFFVVVLT